MLAFANEIYHILRNGDTGIHLSYLGENYMLKIKSLEITMNFECFFCCFFVW